MWRPSYFPTVSKYFCWSKPWCSCIYHLLNYNYISGPELIVYTAPYFQCRPFSWTSCLQLPFWWMHLRLDVSKTKPLIASSHLTAPEVFPHLSNWNSSLSVAQVKTFHGALILSLSYTLHRIFWNPLGAMSQECTQNPLTSYHLHCATRTQAALIASLVYF